ncbi:MAG: four helix bundle protein [Gemmatimonadaceae bacterium]|nr:four helix bundle protein [Gemmatimonadaceae bacterium]
MQDHTKLLVWRKARALTVSVKEIARTFPPTLAPGLRAQLMRSTMSISATIAEGAGRATRVDFARFVTMAASSATETEHHLTVAGDLGLVEIGIVSRLVDRVVEVRRMLYGLHRALIAADEEEPREPTKSKPPNPAEPERRSEEL